MTTKLGLSFRTSYRGIGAIMLNKRALVNDEKKARIVCGHEVGHLEEGAPGTGTKMTLGMVSASAWSPDKGALRSAFSDLPETIEVEVFACSESDIIASNRDERMADRFAREHMAPTAFLRRLVEDYIRIHDLDRETDLRAIDAAVVEGWSDLLKVDAEILTRWLREADMLELIPGGSNHGVWTPRDPELVDSDCHISMPSVSMGDSNGGIWTPGDDGSDDDTWPPREEDPW